LQFVDYAGSLWRNEAAPHSLSRTIGHEERAMVKKTRKKAARKTAKKSGKKGAAKRAKTSTLARKSSSKTKPKTKAKSKSKAKPKTKPKAKSTSKRKVKAASPGLGERISGAYHAVIDTVKGTGTLRDKLERPGTSESE
jgi:hypothetical protein